MERPALRKLLDDVRRRRADVVVVYKVDRLTRSLADFAKLVELFDAYGVSFVSVTQSFNTTTSMGRLTLNVLLSFAQFEREVTGERIRDKIAAAKEKGLWMGGVVPLGYRAEDRALKVVPEHAAFVRTLFRRYLELGGVVRLKEALDGEGVRLPVRTDRSGRTVGGGPILRGHLHKLLSNPVYIGKLRHKDRLHDGQHPAIVERELWDAVQATVAARTRPGAENRCGATGAAPLAGRLFDDRGNAMSPSHASKDGKRWRYYVSQAILQGRKTEAGSIGRASAPEIERAIMEALGACRPDAGVVPTDPWSAVERATVGRTGIELRLAGGGDQSSDGDTGGDDDDGRTIVVPWTPAAKRRRKGVVAAATQDGHADGLRMRAAARRIAISALRDAHRWLGELEAGPDSSVAAIAAREGKTERSIRLTLSLAFLSPRLVEAAVAGNLPRGFGVKRLMEAPIGWSEQWKALGLAPPATA
ncbi:MAG: recombinase family protein [Hyphomicrobiales bacterium]|nr:recombinase family protein [Hyphomicrobiales bacterium]